MEKLILKLAGIMLKDYGDRLSNNVCNIPTNEMIKIINQFKDGEFEEFLNEWNGGECEDGKNYGWTISRAIGDKLLKMSEMIDEKIDTSDTTESVCNCDDIKRLQKPEDGWTHSCSKCGKTWCL